MIFTRLRAGLVMGRESRAVISKVISNYTSDCRHHLTTVTTLVTVGSGDEELRLE